MSSAVIFLAAGSGSRMRGRVQDKILAPLAGAPVLAHSLRAFRAAGVVDTFVFVVRDQSQQSDILKIAVAEGVDASACLFANGGAERQDSVCNGLALLPQATDSVFIHDSARPLIHIETLQALQKAALKDGAAVLAHRVVDTIKKVDPPPHLERRALQDLDRKTLWAMETPQVFQYALIAECYRAVQSAKVRVTDDTAALAYQGHPVTLVENHFPNPKITHPEDLDFVEWLLTRGA